MNTATTLTVIALAVLAVPAAQANTVSTILPVGHSIDDWHGPAGTQVTTTTHFGRVVASFTGPEGLVVYRTMGIDNTTTVQSLDLPAEAPDPAEGLVALEDKVTDLEVTVQELTGTVANLTTALAATRADLAGLGAKLQTATTAAEGAKRAAEDVPRYDMTLLQEGVDAAHASAEKARGVGFIAASAAMIGCLLAVAAVVLNLRRHRTTFEDDGGPLAPPPKPPAAAQPDPIPAPPEPQPEKPTVPAESDIEAWLAKQVKDNPSLVSKLTELGLSAPATAGV